MISNRTLLLAIIVAWSVPDTTARVVFLALTGASLLGDIVAGVVGGTK